jgi:hypothetical protein
VLQRRVFRVALMFVIPSFSLFTETSLFPAPKPSERFELLCSIGIACYCSEWTCPLCRGGVEWSPFFDRIEKVMRSRDTKLRYRGSAIAELDDGDDV